MKKLILLSFIFITISLLNLHAQTAPSIEWQRSFGGSNWDMAYSIQQTFDGGYIVAGSTLSHDGDVSGNHFGYDYWIVRLDVIGNIIWQKCLGGSNDEEASAILNTKDKGFIVVGYSDSNNGDVSGNHGLKDYWVVKLNSSGSLVWQKSLGGSQDDLASSIQQTFDGGYIVAGYSFSNDGDVTGNHGFQDNWAVKLDSLGNVVWEKSLGGSNPDEGNSIQQTSDKGFIVAGYSGSNDGDVSHPCGGYWIVKLDSTGSISWDACFNNGDIDFASTIRQTYDGGYVVTGWTDLDELTDDWIIKLSSTGDMEWSKFLGGSENDAGYSIVQTSDSGYIVAGFTGSTDGDVSGNHGTLDYWIVKIDIEGNIQWQECLGGSNFDNAQSMVNTADGGIILAGFSRSNDGDVSGNHGDFDYWIVKLSAEGVGIENLNQKSFFSISPNPATNLITVQLQSQTNAAFPVSITITNLLGETVFQKTSHCINGDFQETIPIVEKFTEGIYLVRVSSDHQQWSAPLVIAR